MANLENRIKAKTRSRRSAKAFNKEHIVLNYGAINFEEYKGRPINEIPNYVANAVLYHLIGEDLDYTAKSRGLKAVQKF